MTGEDLANAGVTSVDQLQFVSPGATVNNFGQGIDFNIRGIGKGEHNRRRPRASSPIATASRPSPATSRPSPITTSRALKFCAVRKGTFVGQNATGGAVFVTSNNPVVGGDYNGYVRASVGNYNYLGVQGAVNLPISDTLARAPRSTPMHATASTTSRRLYTGDDGAHGERALQPDRGSRRQLLGAVQDRHQLSRSERLSAGSGARNQRSVRASPPTAACWRSTASGARCCN